MTLDTLVTIFFAVMGVVSFISYKVANEVVFLKFKDQRVGK